MQINSMIINHVSRSSIKHLNKQIEKEEASACCVSWVRHATIRAI